MENNKYYASDYCRLDSNVILGGGTDDTRALQALLDKALVDGRVHLVLDGAALTTGLTVHSNTTIECPDASCGLYLADHADNFLITNSGKSAVKIKTSNVTILGGTFNHNCRNQVHHTQEPHEAICETFVPSEFLPAYRRGVMAMEFVGIRDLTLKDVVFRNQRTYAFHCVNFERVNMDNIKIDLPDHMPYQNQDGLHFIGPGRFLNLRNIQGTAGDDIIAITPDEYDCKSDITDVIIDGLMMNNSDQGIRLLSRGTGRLDRVTIRNVTGTYNSYGFYINPWYREAQGNIGSVYIENVFVDHEKPTYDYVNNMLFRVGGKVENLVIKNVFWHAHTKHYSLMDIGLDDGSDIVRHPSDIGNIYIDGLYINEEDFEGKSEYIKVYSNIDNLVIKNLISNSKVPLIKVMEGGCLKKLTLG
ncbi:MAG: hypothetical protein IK083_01480 [Abditibacteriota bacterium]|nr:hypothetical protein [Abditibacteriota bacterium]